MQGSALGLAEMQKSKRESMCAAAAVLAAATASYAQDIGNHDLKKRASFTKAELLKGRDTYSATKCLGVHAAATEAGTGLAEHLVGAPAKITDLSDKIAAYQAAITSPTDARKKARAATQSLKADLARARQILTEHLDKLILQFEESAPDFFKDYWIARTPPSSPGTHTTAEEPTPSPPPPPTA